MMRILVLGVLAVALVAGVIIGCGPRARVAGKKVMNEIDELLGKFNIQEEKVLGALKEAKSATETIRDKKIEAEVQVKNFARKREALTSDREKSVAELRKLKELITEAEANEGVLNRNGKEIEIGELKGYADATVKKVRLIDDKIKSNDTIAAAWGKNLEMMKKQADVSKTQLAKLEDQIDAIRSKKTALDAMKEAESIIGPNESINDKFNKLTEEVDKLIVDVDTEWAKEEAKLEERMVEMDSPSISLDELLSDETDVSETMNDIDEILGGGN